MITRPLKSEVILAGTFELQGSGDVGNLDEFLAPAFPVGTGINPAPFPHGNRVANRLIHADQPWEVKLSWTVGGIMAHTVNPAYYWEIEILMEQWGATDYELPVALRKRSVYYGTGNKTGAGPAQLINYPGTASTTVSIPGGVVPPGVYDVVAVLRLVEDDKVTPCFLAAFAEFGKIDFYEGH